MLLVVWGALAAPFTPDELPNPRDEGGWVVDGAGVLSPASEGRINARIDQLKHDKGAEIAVVTVPDVVGTPKEFATAVFNRWGVGEAGVDNGALLLVVVDQRRAEIEVGYGAEAVLPDGRVGRILDDACVPRFRQGAYGDGIEAGVAAIDEALRGMADTVAPARRTGDDILINFAWGLIRVGALGAVPLAGGGILWWFWRRKRQCPTCRRVMRRLDDVEEDKHLSAGQVAEEASANLDYEVRVCDEHQQVVVIAHRRRAAVACTACTFRALRHSQSILRQPTFAEEGLIELTATCAHCGHTTVTQHTLLQPTRGGGSHRGFGSRGFGGGFRGGGGGGGGSFGGGRSGGGGAGRGW